MSKFRYRVGVTGWMVAGVHRLVGQPGCPKKNSAIGWPTSPPKKRLEAECSPAEQAGGQAGDQAAAGGHFGWQGHGAASSSVTDQVVDLVAGWPTTWQGGPGAAIRAIHNTHTVASIST